MSASLLRSWCNDLCDSFNEMSETSLSTACYPIAWETTHIVPAANVENYLPINISSVVSRAMKIVIKAAVVQNLLTINIISTSQYRFLRSRSWDTCLVDRLNDITLKRNDKILVLVLFLYFKRASIKVPQKRLLVKLKSFGINNLLHSWFAPFETERKQKIKYNDFLSSHRPMTNGVIQINVLGPPLFSCIWTMCVTLQNLGDPTYMLMTSR